MNYAKAKKTRAKKYDNKLKINGSFEDVIRLSVGKKPEEKKEEPKKPSKKK